MDESKPDDNHTRRPTLVTSPRQAWVSHSGTAVLGALVVLLTPYFQTKQEGQAQGAVLVVQAAQILELKSAIEKSEGRIIEKINDVVKPIAASVEKQETRIVFLEQTKMQKEKTR